MFPDQHKFAFSCGDTINDFKVISVIGRGGFGEVYLVQDVAGARFALKLLLRAEDKEFAGNSQIRALENISGFVTPHAAGTLPDGRHFFLMPLADNLNRGEVYTPDTLANRLSKFGRLPTAELLDIAIAITSACAELHKKQLVHGDIKPENVIFIRKQALLSDFSLVRPMAPPDESGIAGTLRFIPQEEVSGQLNGVSEQLDLYAIGMLLYSSYNLNPAIDYPAPGDGIDLAEYRVIRKIYNKALHKNPAFRYRDAATLLRDLKQAKEKIISDKLPWFRRKKFTYSLLAGALIAIVAGVLTPIILHEQRFFTDPVSKEKIDLDAITPESLAGFFAKIDQQLLDLLVLQDLYAKVKPEFWNDPDFIFLTQKINALLNKKLWYAQLKTASDQRQVRQSKRKILSLGIPQTPGDVLLRWRELITPENFLTAEEFKVYQQTPTSATDPRTHLKTYGATELNRAKIKIETLTNTTNFGEFQNAIDDFRRLIGNPTATEDK